MGDQTMEFVDFLCTSLTMVFYKKKETTPKRTILFVLVELCCYVESQRLLFSQSKIQISINMGIKWYLKKYVQGKHLNARGQSRKGGRDALTEES